MGLSKLPPRIGYGCPLAYQLNVHKVHFTLRYITLKSVLIIPCLIDILGLLNLIVLFSSGVLPKRTTLCFINAKLFMIILHTLQYSENHETDLILATVP